MKSTQTYPNQKLVNGLWGYSYNQEERMMLGGYSEDGKSFTHTFTVTGVDRKDVMFAIALCGLTYGKTRTVVTSYQELVGEEDFGLKMLRFDVELHNK